MQVKILFDTPKYKVGETPHLRTETAQSLIDTGYAEPYTPPASPGRVTWVIGNDEISGAVTLHGSCSNGCGNYRFFGAPGLLPRYPFQHACLTSPTPVPENVIQKYSMMRSGAAAHPVPAERRDTLSVEDAVAISNSQAKAIDNARLDAQIKREGGGRTRIS